MINSVQSIIPIHVDIEQLENPSSGFFSNRRGCSTTVTTLDVLSHLR
jgi:hypothetical protein